MASRLELQTLLGSIQGVKKVYFQPPESVKMVYPCIVYGLSKIDPTFADNVPYKHDIGYTLTIIDKDPTSKIPFIVKDLPKCKFDRTFTSDNLNHWVFTLFY